MPEVVVAGGGPSGLAAAIALAERGVRTCVVDAQAGRALNRGELLPQAAAPILDRLNLSQVLRTAIQVQDVKSHWGRAHLHAHGSGPTLGLHGWGIDRRDLARHMRARLQSLRVPIIAARLTRHKRLRDGWHIDLQGPKGADGLAARFLIDATGRSARIARRNGATLLQGADLVGLIWQGRSQRPAHMLSEATAEGWWYSVPHRSGRTVGFMTSARRMKEIALRPEAYLRSAGQELTLISADDGFGEPRRVDARSAVLDRMSGPGWLATGDAAAAFDPISSQGLFNALSGGFFAGHAAADAIAGDTDAPLVYAALAARTAERTHAATHLQYAALPFQSSFWRDRCVVGRSKGKDRANAQLEPEGLR